MRVAFDVDGVLRDLMSVYAPLVGMTVGDITTYDKVVEMAGSSAAFLQSCDDHHCWAQAAPYANMAAFCRELSRTAEVVIITAQVTMQSQRETLAWLHDHDIPWTEVHFCVNKLRVVFDAIIEDKPETALAAAKAGKAAFLVQCPWTAGTPRRRNLFLLPPDAEAGAVVREVLASRGKM
jgi:5'(3')-deoxyribonucleotidase